MGSHFAKQAAWKQRQQHDVMLWKQANLVRRVIEYFLTRDYAIQKQQTSEN